MTLQVPKIVTVLGMPYTVEVVTPQESMFRGSPWNVVGSTENTFQRIRIRNSEDISMPQAVETLLHEVLHAIIYTFGLSPLLRDEEDAEENLVNALSPALLHTLRSNPALVEALMVPFTSGGAEGTNDE